ncbi:hypothetical protein [Pseudomonas aeruginosa]|uniref:hypothetical protein n=1 Tax=Pseudomonas aeruginosa TaxID=287 RepID=UPI00053F2805|nr:hypothetical protein [Pseudomonas aeruginosa]KSO41675.1 hypothetical protein APB05_16770 [Pseudomonas aeruginosa]MBG7134444.1 hypothetical protein [Pseudomonas aeruginosa]MDP5479067.1 hypothetical protein [Pseudomonas aeruginosa]MDP5521242.1 hypothetical protein [Pseudomonas aeruginosa]OHW55288.1 hypothetical protein ABI36_0231920 [Pseudomonas aeruginosa]
MSSYEVKTSDGIVHKAEANTHIIDSIGLHLYADAGRVVAVFRTFEWVRVYPEVVTVPVEPEQPAPETTTSPEATGE